MGDFAHLPTLKADQLTSCVGCDRSLVESGFPLFYRFGIKRAGLDRKALDERIGLTTMFGRTHRAAGLAEVFASRDPAVVIDAFAEVNVCHQCMERLTVMDLFLAVMGRDDGKRSATIESSK